MYKDTKRKYTSINILIKQKGTCYSKNPLNTITQYTGRQTRTQKHIYIHTSIYGGHLSDTYTCICMHQCMEDICHTHTQMHIRTCINVWRTSVTHIQTKHICINVWRTSVRQIHTKHTHVYTYINVWRTSVTMGQRLIERVEHVMISCVDHLLKRTFVSVHSMT